MFSAYLLTFLYGCCWFKNCSGNSLIVAKNPNQLLAVNWGFYYRGGFFWQPELDTRAWAETAAGAQRSMGYQATVQTSKGEPGITTEVIKSVSGASIFTIAAHGEFRARFHETTLRLPHASYIVTGDVNPYPNVRNAEIAYLKNVDFTKCKFAMFLHCMSTCPPKGCSGGEGMDIAALAVKKGCDVALGFYGMPDPEPYVSYFVQQFWNEVQTKDIFTAVKNAKHAVKTKFGDYGGTDTAVLKWRKGIPSDYKLAPTSSKQEK